MKRQRLAPEQVDALFRRETPPTAPQEALERPSRAYVPRYDRCALCRERQPCLFPVRLHQSSIAQILVCPLCLEHALGLADDPETCEALTLAEAPLYD